MKNESNTEYLFEAVDPRSYTVKLSSDQYYNHIVSSDNHQAHTEFSPAEIKECVEHPDAIYQSSDWKDRDLYYGRSSAQFPKLFLKTIVSLDDGSKTGEVVTAFLTKSFSGGAEGGLKYVKPKL